MCGIVGIWDRTRRVDRTLLENMRDTLHHRGPDDRGVFIDETGHIGLGHQRLAILDTTEAGHQPMSFDGVWTVHNGEIYNFRDIRERLAARGHSFVTETDTEVILKGYREWGIDVVERFRGMFVTVLWDERDGKLVIVRDRPGVKPLYYYHDENLFIFASELKAIILHPAVERDIDFDALSLYLKLGYIPAPLSIFKKISKLEAGHTLTLDRSGRLNSNRYWNVFDYFAGQSDLRDATEEEATDALEKILLDSFKLRMVSDVPVGVFLSGGVDSSTIAALIQSETSKPIQTFTVGFEESGYNEAEQAKQVARHLGTDHHELYVTSQMALDVIPRLPEIYDEPFGDASSIPTFLIAQFARNHVKVALSADGGDEVFAGYVRHRHLEKTYRAFSRLGRSERYAATLLGAFPFRQIAGLKIKNIELKIKKLQEIARKERSISEFMFVGMSKWPEADIGRLLGDRAGGFEQFMQPFHQEEKRISEVINFMRAADYRAFLADDILVKVDRATMAVGLEGREPLLDQNVVEFAAGLPVEYLFRNGESKYILRKILDKFVPRELVDRPKQGFEVPLDVWFKKELKDLLLDHLSEGTIRDAGIFDWDMVKKETDDFLSGRMTSSTRLWLLLEFEMWRKKWMT